MHVNTAGIEEQLILRKRKPAIFQKDFLVPSECYLLLYLDCTDYKATSYSGQWSANVSSIQQPPTKSYLVQIPPATANNCSSIQHPQAYLCFIEITQAISTHEV